MSEGARGARGREREECGRVSSASKNPQAQAREGGRPSQRDVWVLRRHGGSAVLFYFYFYFLRTAAASCSGTHLGSGLGSPPRGRAGAIFYTPEVVARAGRRRTRPALRTPFGSVRFLSAFHDFVCLRCLSDWHASNARPCNRIIYIGSTRSF